MMNKIIVIGTTGSGKSTFARALSDKLEIPYIQLDALFWKPDWQHSSEDEFFKKIDECTNQPRWVVDGNYTNSNHIHWHKADTVIWIDLPLWLTFYQSFTRSFKRALSGKEIWRGTGNKESFVRMFSKDSILLWLLKTYRRNREKYEMRMNDDAHGHIKFVRLQSRGEISDFLESELS